VTDLTCFYSKTKQLQCYQMKFQEQPMLNAKKIEEIAKQVTDSIPPGLKNLANNFEDKTKSVLQRKLSQLDVVTREEFDVQTQVLIKTRSKIAELELRLTELEANLMEE
jgi:BMFP domain-containing protein YqiC